MDNIKYRYFIVYVINHCNINIYKNAIVTLNEKFKTEQQILEVEKEMLMRINEQANFNIKVEI